MAILGLSGSSTSRHRVGLHIKDDGEVSPVFTKSSLLLAAAYRCSQRIIYSAEGLRPQTRQDSCLVARIV